MNEERPADAIASELIRLADTRPVEEYQKYAMKNGKRLAWAYLSEREENGRLLAALEDCANEMREAGLDASTPVRELRRNGYPVPEELETAIKKDEEGEGKDERKR